MTGLCSLVMNDPTCVFTWASWRIAGMLRTLPVDMKASFTPFHFKQAVCVTALPFIRFPLPAQRFGSALTHLGHHVRDKLTESYPVTKRTALPRGRHCSARPGRCNARQKRFSEGLLSLLWCNEGVARCWEAHLRMRRTNNERGFVCKTNLQL